MASEEEKSSAAFMAGAWTGRGKKPRESFLSLPQGTPGPTKANGLKKSDGGKRWEDWISPYSFPRQTIEGLPRAEEGWRGPKPSGEGGRARRPKEMASSSEPLGEEAAGELRGRSEQDSTWLPARLSPKPAEREGTNLDRARERGWRYRLSHIID